MKDKGLYIPSDLRVPVAKFRTSMLTGDASWQDCIHYIKSLPWRPLVPPQRAAAMSTFISAPAETGTPWSIYGSTVLCSTLAAFPVS
jgi:hypothetical protein